MPENGYGEHSIQGIGDKHLTIELGDEAIPFRRHAGDTAPEGLVLATVEILNRYALLLDPGDRSLREKEMSLSEAASFVQDGMRPSFRVVGEPPGECRRRSASLSRQPTTVGAGRAKYTHRPQSLSSSRRTG